MKKATAVMIATTLIVGITVSDVGSDAVSGGNALVNSTFRVVTAYNAGDIKQNSGDPCVAASGENLCRALREGNRRCAANFVPFGTTLFIDNYGTCVVTDRTNRRYENRVDIAMMSHELPKAKKFGRQVLKVGIVGNRPSHQ